MRAVVASSAGGPEVLEIRTVDDPVPGPSELLIDVVATALNRPDLLQRRGLYPPPPGAPEILGLECSGVVVGLGPGASTDWLGQAVMALLPGGGYAEKVVVPERMAMRSPRGDHIAAAAIPEVFLTASEALFEEARLAPGQVVLIHAAAGGVGSAAVQLARNAGARVIATCGGPEKCRFVEQLGAEFAVDRHDAPFVEVIEQRLGERAVDVVVDLVGAAHWEGNLRVLADGGRLVSVGVLSGGKVTLDLGRLLRRQLKVLGMVMRPRSVLEKIAVTQRFIRRWLPLFESGALCPVVDRVFALEEVREAHAYMEQNRNLGKLVLRVRGGSSVTGR